ncbi:MAG: ThiF family adenylyltransferase [Candidatus Omnitrophica bacterium]|nr:ThiF family adenylyltransferase [Candidatus Omnitrophota bacterium]
MAEQRYDYDSAFVSHLGLLTAEEQAQLRRAVVAIPGMGAVGGAHLLTLARLGIGSFAIADHDRFEARNLNRQLGATIETIGQPKTAVMGEMARAVNPELTIKTFPDGIHQDNIDDFLKGCQVVVDGLDFFRIDVRRLLFRRARERGVPVVTCGPLGFGVAMLIFMPEGPSFDEFFAIHDGMEEREQLARFAVGLAPAGLHVPYLDLRAVRLRERRGPSCIIAMNLCAGVAAVEVLNLVLKRRKPWAVPRYLQFDAYRQQFRRGTLVLGNRHPWQQVKLWVLKQKLRHVPDA